jgi:plasmid stabilization system protein ParE
MIAKPPERARRWYDGLLQADQSLAQFPRRCPLAAENEAFPEAGVRQLLYGTGRGIFRLLFYVREREEGELPTVRILHVRHASQRRLVQQEQQDEDDDASD